MIAPTEIFIACDLKEFAGAFCQSIEDLKQAIEEEIRDFVGNDESEIDRIKPIFREIFGKAVSKHEKAGGVFADHHSRELQKAFSRGITLKEFQLSRLIYLIERLFDELSNSNMKEAFNSLSLANRYLGEYRNNNELYEFFDTSFRKKEQHTFKRDTLLKLIFGMVRDGYNGNHSNINNSTDIISKRLHKRGIQVNKENIIEFLGESYGLVKSWKELNTNEGVVTETEQNTMLKLIIGMAIDKYGYDPNSALNKATGPGSDGISGKIRPYVCVNNGTIRNCLEVAKKIILPPQ